MGDGYHGIRPACVGAQDEDAPTVFELNVDTIAALVREAGFPCYQENVALDLGATWANVINGECGWCGRAGQHDTKDCTDPIRKQTRRLTRESD